MENFIRIYQVNHKLCNDLIKYYKTNKEYKSVGATSLGIDKNVKDSIDVKFYNHSSHKTILNFFKTLGENLQKYLNEFQIEHPFITDNANLIQYYPKNGGFKIFHYESSDLATINRKLVYMLYLNNISDGGTEFKYQNIVLEAKKGNLVIWPAEFTHTHRGVVSKTKEKYIATGWFKFKI